MSNGNDLVGRFCWRKPAGRIARIVDYGPRGLKIRDCIWCGWVTRKTFERDWEMSSTEAQPERQQSENT